MPKLAIVATIDVKPGRREEFLPLLMAHRARCLKDEPGTVQFEVLVPREDNSKLLLYEVYQDDAAFEKHFSGPSSIVQGRSRRAAVAMPPAVHTATTARRALRLASSSSVCPT